jgi:mediator of RNA polymerase II transcription subunit 12, fungi type
MFPHIAMLAQEDDTSLATNLWMRHGFTANWVQEVWQTSLECLREISRAEAAAESRHTRILRYARFLWDIDQHLLPGALDQLVFQWAVGPGRTEFPHLDSDIWSALSTVLLYLVARDALTAPNVMKSVVYPAWELSTTIPGSSSSVMLRSVNHIASRLLVHDQANLATTSNEHIDEMQKLQTRRRAIYAEENFSLLVTALPNLVTLEHKEDVDDELRDSITRLRTAISKHPEFRMVAYRNLELVSRAFWNVDAQSLPQNVERHLGSALQQILSDSEPCGYELLDDRIPS